MTVKFEKFKEALVALCLEHKVSLATSMYDNLEVWDFDPNYASSDGPIHGGADEIVDQTKE